MSAVQRGGSAARWAAAALASLAIGAALLRLGAAEDGLVATTDQVGPTPITLYALEDAPPGPAVVIAHGFAGSQTLMAPFAITLARSGYRALTFDFLGHGRNAASLTGDVTREDGATRALVAETRRMLDHARALPGVDGRVALLGHSMASDIIVRAAKADGAVAATVAVSMFSREVTADAPRNLLMVVGGYEAFLTQEALAAAALKTGGRARAGVTYGDPAAGAGRRVVVADGVEHIGVLYSRESLEEARDWLNAVFGRSALGAPDARGPWILLLFAGIFVLAWPLARLAPRASGLHAAGLGGDVPRRAVWVAALAPAVATPLLLWKAPTSFLPILVADYLALHFLLYGGLTALALWRFGAARPTIPRPGALAIAVGGGALYALLAFGGAVDAFVTSFALTPARAPLMAALLIGTLPYFLADEWLTRGPGAPWWAYPLTKLGFLASLGFAVALNLPKLFFLIIIVPVILVFFALFGAFSGWLARATGHPWAGGAANAIVFSWAIAATFPFLDA